MPYKDRERQKQAQRESYKKNKETILARQNTVRRQQAQWLQEYKSSLSCVVCGEDEPCCLEFHHTDPKQKEFKISGALRRSKNVEEVLREIEKCIVLCSNCHKKLHAGVMSMEA
jgi:hypothetical protein